MRRFAIDEADMDSVRVVECGLHSGFPLCCIMFYAKIWRPWVVTLPSVCEEGDFDLVKMHRILRRIDPALELASVRQWAYVKQCGEVGYIRCPACVLNGNVVKVQRCEHSDPIDV